MIVVSRSIGSVLAAALVACAGLAHAQVRVPQKVIEEAAQDRCEESVVVRDCARRTADPEPRKTDEIGRSRDRAKAGLARNARESRAAAAAPRAADARPNGDAQQLAPVTVTGEAGKGPPPSPEAVIQKALNPETTVLPNGNTLRYAPDGTRIECQSHCSGPACCKSMRDRPDPAALSNSMGR